MKSKKRYLVTGGAGFVGSHLVDRLLRAGYSVVVVDDFSTGKEENLASHRGDPKLQVVRQNAAESLESVFKPEPIAAVFHLAALPQVQLSIQDPRQTHLKNVDGTVNVLTACRDFGVKRFVFSSSAAVYGGQEISPVTEEVQPDPLSPYALHKQIGEQYCRLFARLYGLETICLRYFNVYGPRQNPEGGYASLIPKFISLLSAGKRLTINGDGEQTRDFVFVSDVVEANIKAMETKDSSCFGDVFNVGTGRAVSVNEVTDALIKLSGKQIQPRYGPAVVEVRHSLAGIAKIEKALGWQPVVQFQQGLSMTYKKL